MWNLSEHHDSAADSADAGAGARAGFCQTRSCISPLNQHWQQNTGRLPSALGSSGMHVASSLVPGGLAIGRLGHKICHGRYSFQAPHLLANLASPVQLWCAASQQLSSGHSSYNSCYGPTSCNEHHTSAALDANLGKWSAAACQGGVLMTTWPYHETGEGWKDIDGWVNLPVLQLPVHIHLALCNVACQVGNRMCDVVIGHGQNGKLSDGPLPTLDTSSPLIDGSQICVHVT